jgi:hypothetical protein
LDNPYYITRIPLSFSYHHIALKNPNSFGHAKPNFSHQITPKNKTKKQKTFSTTPSFPSKVTTMDCRTLDMLGRP